MNPGRSIILAALAILSCSESQSDDPPRTPNVLVIVVDTR